MTFNSELTALLSKYGWDESTDTPDFILTDHLVSTLKTLQTTNRHCTIWKAI